MKSFQKAHWSPPGSWSEGRGRKGHTYFELSSMPETVLFAVSIILIATDQVS